MGLVAGEEDVGDRNRGSRGCDRGDQMDSAARERERVERGRRCDHGDRARRVIDGEESEHKSTGDGKRRGRRSPAQHQNRRCCKRERKRERTRRRIGPHSNSDRDDRAHQNRHRRIEQVRGVVLHEPNLARLQAAHILL
jgi:hypothetical protein